MAAASTVASGEATAAAATSLPPAVRVRLYELFVQVRDRKNICRKWTLPETLFSV